MSDFLLIERRPPAAIVTLNRPDKQNALNAELLSALDTELAQFDLDDEIRGVILTGNDKVFSTGGDLKEGLAVDTISDIHNWLSLFARANSRLENLRKPVIAAINGYCVTGGLELALCCDIRIAGIGAQFGVTSSRIGTVAGAGATQRLARLLRPDWAKELLFSGDFIDAQKALEIGLVTEIVDRDKVMDTALSRVESYARRAPLSVWYAKLAINNGRQMDLQSGLNYERQLTAGLFATGDRKEGMAAFLEKRPPQFKGK
jgi:enoyl-CoA hydratase/carnithine racemase